jgi:two-component system sensor histidine kinase KdpD
MGVKDGERPPITADAARFASVAARALHDRLRAMMITLAVVEDHVSTSELSRDAIKQQLAAMHSHMFWLQQHAENMLLAEALVEGMVPLNRRPIDLHDLAEDVQTVMEPVLVERNQALLVEIPEDLPAVMGDVRWLCHALFNLLSNAAKHSPSGTTIEVRAAARRLTLVEGGRQEPATLAARAGPAVAPAPDTAVRITVADCGPGIDTGTPSPFDSSFGGGGTDREHAPGLGLGLAVVRAITHAHGGRVGAHNRSEGGAVFWMELPALVPQNRALRTLVSV